MLAADTNVWARAYLNDDKAQAAESTLCPGASRVHRRSNRSSHCSCGTVMDNSRQMGRDEKHEHHRKPSPDEGVVVESNWPWWWRVVVVVFFFFLLHSSSCWPASSCP